MPCLISVCQDVTLGNYESDVVSYGLTGLGDYRALVNQALAGLDPSGFDRSLASLGYRKRRDKRYRVSLSLDEL